MEAGCEAATIATARKRLHVITWGCQMNVYDSGRMADVLAPLGYAPAAVPEGADMVSSTPATSATKPPRRSFRSSAVYAA